MNPKRAPTPTPTPTGPYSTIRHIKPTSNPTWVRVPPSSLVEHQQNSKAIQNVSKMLPLLQSLLLAIHQHYIVAYLLLLGVGIFVTIVVPTAIVYMLGKLVVLPFLLTLWKCLVHISRTVLQGGIYLYKRSLYLVFVIVSHPFWMKEVVGLD